jgi:hypothetical protein
MPGIQQPQCPAWGIIEDLVAGHPAVRDVVNRIGIRKA